jgi:hypothetical protein
MRIYWLSLLLIFSACGKDDDAGPEYPELAIDLVTGLYLTDENGVPLDTLGNPNVWNEDVEIYPNPANGNFLVKAQQAIDTLWLIAATGQKTQLVPGVDYQALLEAQTYTSEEVRSLPLQTYTPEVANFVIDPGNLEAGYYRLFFKRSDGSIVWNNLYFHPDKTLEESRNELFDFWE